MRKHGGGLDYKPTVRAKKKNKKKTKTKKQENKEEEEKERKKKKKKKNIRRTTVSIATQTSIIRHSSKSKLSLSVRPDCRVVINPCPAEPGYTLHLQTV